MKTLGKVLTGSWNKLEECTGWRERVKEDLISKGENNNFNQNLAWTKGIYHPSQGVIFFYNFLSEYFVKILKKNTGHPQLLVFLSIFPVDLKNSCEI